MNYTPVQCVDFKQREELLRVTCTEILGELVVNMLIAGGFLTAPASTKYHGNYAGGLFDHSVNVARALEAFTKDGYLLWKESDPERAPWVVGILHDLCKIDQYYETYEGFGYNNNTLVKGHGTKSVIYAQAIGARLSAEERACIIYHMGAFTPKEEWGDYTNAIHTYPSVLWTHQADMVATHIMEV